MQASIVESPIAVNTLNQEQKAKTARILRALSQDTGRPNQQHLMNENTNSENETVIAYQVAMINRILSVWYEIENSEPIFQ